MKLNPPASSSDLETAREVARRLHMRRRRQDLDAPETSAPAPAPARRRPPIPARGPVPEAPAGRRPAPPSPAPAPAPVPEFDAGPEPHPPPSWDAPAGEPSSPDSPLGVLADFGETPAPVEAKEPDDLELPDVDVEGPGVSAEAMIGLSEPELSAAAEPEVEPDPALEDLAAPESTALPSPFEIDLDEGATAEDEMVGGDAVPSWDEIADACLDLSQAGAAMIIDPAGQVFAARGDWPAPGPQAIAARLVATMDRTLKDAPTRAISAPFGGRHLSAWRVPLAEGLVTVAFFGESPVTEARPSIDAEIHRGAGA